MDGGCRLRRPESWNRFRVAKSDLPPNGRWLVTLLMLTAATLSAQTPVAPPGKGTPADPYRISKLGHLVWMQGTVAQSAGKHYKLVNDIDAQATTTWHENSGFEPIGSEEAPFRGTFDGNKRAIENLTIRRGTQGNVGLFGCAAGADIRDLKVDNAFIRGNSRVGILVGKMIGTRIERCDTSGQVEGGGVVFGGLAGYNDYGTIVDSSSSAFVTATAETMNIRKYAGGLAGINRGGRMVRCTASGMVVGEGAGGGPMYVGGLTSQSEQGVFEECRVNSQVLADGWYTGGLIADSYMDEIIECSASGWVSGGGYYTGGLIGYACGSRILRCATHGYVDGSSETGGIVGSQTSSEIHFCETDAEINGRNLTGGLVGLSHLGSIRNSFSMARLTRGYAGGLVGGAHGTWIGFCYAAGVLHESAGGLVAEADDEASVTSSYWDFETTGAPQSKGGIGRSTFAMKLQSTYVGWDFSHIWGISPTVNHGYPHLRLSVAQQIVPLILSPPVSEAGVKAGLIMLEVSAIGKAPLNYQWFFQSSTSSEPTAIHGATNSLFSITNAAPVHSGWYSVAVTNEAGRSVSPPASVTVLGPAYGSGGETDPFQIATLDDLVWMQKTCEDSTGKQYRLVNDIEASATTNWHAGAGFKPIGGELSGPFQGWFDGNHHTIRGLWIARPDADNVGLFGSLGDMARISNLRLEGCVIVGANNVGGLAGYGGRISNCRMMGQITGQDCVGGLVGCCQGQVDHCQTRGTVNGQIDVGGLVGRASIDGIIRSSLSHANVAGNIAVGGLVGNLDWTFDRIENCYAMGSVLGNESTGGLVGFVESRIRGKIQNCYAVGLVAGQQEVGGLIGSASVVVPIDSSYWGWETTGQTRSAGGGGAPRSNEQLRQVSTFLDWDFVQVWGMESCWNDGLPFLRAIEEPPCAPVVPSLGIPRHIQFDEGKLRIEISGGPLGTAFEIQGSSDLVNWEAIGSVTNSGGPAVFSESKTYPSCRFYRARSVPGIP
ncbi:MAG TPA: hypothetical protein PK256_17120, partial [Verrucomicrobiota bacterium]|nr:hypothetical protein [Verrucomicrobiota bacterium]